MDLASVRTIKQLLARQSMRPSRGFGQNFLIDQNAIQKLVFAAQIRPEDAVLEIGPGIGTLTQELAQRAKRVVAIEKDVKMVEILKETLAAFNNIKIIHADALHIPYSIRHTPYKVVANLPYYITAPVIRKFLEDSKATRIVRLDSKAKPYSKPYSIAVIVQKEVAQRICAKPPDMNILAVSVQIYATPKIISYIKKTAFWPKPKVDAAILHITPHPQPYPLNFPKFFTVVKAGFKQPRKQLVNNLSVGLSLSREKTEHWLLQNNIQPTQRAETLSLQDWRNLTNML